MQSAMSKVAIPITCSCCNAASEVLKYSYHGSERM